MSLAVGSEKRWKKEGHISARRFVSGTKRRSRTYWFSMLFSCCPCTSFSVVLRSVSLSFHQHMSGLCRLRQCRSYHTLLFSKSGRSALVTRSTPLHCSLSTTPSLVTRSSTQRQGCVDNNFVRPFSRILSLPRRTLATKATRLVSYLGHASDADHVPPNFTST